VEQKVIRFAIIGAGLMGREFASAAARWCHLAKQDVRPQIVAVCDPSPAARQWFTDHVPSCTIATDDYKALLAEPSIDAIYVAVPHNLHAEIYSAVIRAGKAMLGEKPFGIDASIRSLVMI